MTEWKLYLNPWHVSILCCFFYINSISFANESWQSLREVLGVAIVVVEVHGRFLIHRLLT
jgi:hypothetical protein